MEHRPRVTHGYAVILPVVRQRLHLFDHLLRGQTGARNKLSALLLPGCENFDVSPAHIDRKHAHEISPPLTTSAWTVDDPNVIVQNSSSLFCQWSGIDQPSARTFAHPLDNQSRGRDS